MTQKNKYYSILFFLITLSLASCTTNKVIKYSSPKLGLGELGGAGDLYIINDTSFIFLLSCYSGHPKFRVHENEIAYGKLETKDSLIVFTSLYNKDNFVSGYQIDSLNKNRFKCIIRLEGGDKENKVFNRGSIIVNEKFHFKISCNKNYVEFDKNDSLTSVNKIVFLDSLYDIRINLPAEKFDFGVETTIKINAPMTYLLPKRDKRLECLPVSYTGDEYRFLHNIKAVKSNDSIIFLDTINDNGLYKCLIDYKLTFSEKIRYHKLEKLDFNDYELRQLLKSMQFR